MSTQRSPAPGDPGDDVPTVILANPENDVDGSFAARSVVRPVTSDSAWLWGDGMYVEGLFWTPVQSTLAAVVALATAVVMSPPTCWCDAGANPVWLAWA